MRARVSARSYLIIAAISAIPGLLVSRLAAQDAHFHNAPTASAQQSNPYAKQDAAVTAGGKLYATYCVGCHGANGQGTGNVPPLTQGAVQTVSDGEVFWFITTGSVSNGMPAWGMLPEQQRWQLVSFVKSLKNSAVAATSSAPLTKYTPVTTNAPQPQPPFTDFRFEKPGTIRKITVKDLPAPYATDTANNGPELVARPENAWPKAPAGFNVQLYATGLNNPRLIRTAPNGDFFLAESNSGNIKSSAESRPTANQSRQASFATGLNHPYGIAFYPPGPNPQWVYVGNTNSVVRFPYKNGDLKASGPAQHIADLPLQRGPLDARCSVLQPDGKKMFVAVGSASNVDDPDTTPGEKRSRRHSGVQPRWTRACASMPTEFAMPAAGWRSIPRRASCGARSTSATAWATTLCPTTSRTSRKAASTAGRGGTWATIRIRGIRANIRS